MSVVLRLSTLVDGTRNWKFFVCVIVEVFQWKRKFSDSVRKIMGAVKINMHVFVAIILYSCIFISAGDEGLKYDLLKMTNLYEGVGHKYNALPSAYPEECIELLNDFAKYASNLTMCSIQNARPVRVCEECIEEYVLFSMKYKELLDKVVNGTSCRSVFISHDRLEVILEYHDNILSLWNKGNCNECYDWSKTLPVLSNSTIHFKKLLNDTVTCIKTTINPFGNNTDEVCARCMQSYVQLDKFYRSLSKDSIGLESVCFDIVDSMNTTRSIWSKDLNCCKRLRSPETIFLWCTGIISILPVLFYAIVRYFTPLRDLPRALKESRFKQSFLRSSDGGIN